MKHKKYRNELKYICSEAELAQIKNRIVHLLKKDPHAGETGVYSIRSVYFDTYDNQFYYENENGVDKREKFRIRVYNGDFNNIKLELKGKEYGMTWKQSCRLSEKQCKMLLEGKNMSITPENPELLNKLLLKVKLKGLRPVVIVEYERMPFVCIIGNVRITFDKNVRSGNRIEDFWNQKLTTRPILPTGKHILEVKYDELIPDYIKQSIQIANLQRTAFSKFYMCRKYTIGGTRNDIFRYI